MFLPGRALVDPELQFGDLGGGEGFVRSLGRHAARGSGGGDALVEEAVGGLAGDDGGAVFAELEGGFLVVEAEVGHAGVGVGAVALEAVVGEEGADFALEVDSRGGLCKQKARRGKRQGSGCGATMKTSHLC